MNQQSLASLQLIFFTTSGCHLCEQAEQLLLELNQQLGVKWAVVDISSEAKLVERYGIRIPVLRNDSNDTELGWPFDLSMLTEFVGNDVAGDLG